MDAVQITGVWDAIARDHKTFVGLVEIAQELAVVAHVLSITPAIKKLIGNAGTSNTIAIEVTADAHFSGIEIGA